MSVPQPSRGFDPSALPPRLPRAVFDAVCEMTYRLSGIVLRDGKEDLVQSRLVKRLRALNIGSFEAYLELVQRDPEELARMMDVLTTNKTNFFREPGHFEIMKKQLIPAWSARGGEVRIWSAACSSGEEPYTIAMTLIEEAPMLERRARILATDLSSNVLAKARKGVYATETVADVPGPLKAKHFEKVDARSFQVSARLRKLVHFARLNLLDPWPMQGPFQVIFCRNVMIYFDKETQLGLARRFRDLLEPGGLLFIGHSESLGQEPDVGLQYERPAVYSRC